MITRDMLTIIIFCILSTTKVIFCQLFTSIAEMEAILHIEATYIKCLESVAKQQEEMATQLFTKIEEYNVGHNEAKKDIATYLSNPINAFLMTKRLTTDWSEMVQDMPKTTQKELSELLKTSTANLKVPTELDLNGIASALARLQSIYLMNASSIADGKLNGVQYKTARMTASDCYQLGVQLYNSENYRIAIEWFEETLTRLPGNEKQWEQTIKSYLSAAHFVEGNLTVALEITNQMLEKEPHNKIMLANRKEIEQTIEESQSDKNETPSAEHITETYGDEQFVKLCRQELKPSSTELSKVHCRYITNGIAFLRIGPLKMEECFQTPYIVIFHDVLFDSEIKHMQSVAKPSLQRSRIKDNTNDNRNIVSELRTSSSVFITEEHKRVQYVCQRVSDMTKLSAIDAEALQVVNYGIGGHYVPHIDAFDEADSSEFRTGSGNRIATVLFYMNDVEQGGATVFPYLNVGVLPEKGSALVWFNLYEDGQPDYRTRHGSCPVLVGNKWIANKWIRSAEQMFRYPCKLEPHCVAKLPIPGFGTVDLLS